MVSRPRKSGDLASTIKAGDRRAALEALRDVLADSLVAAEPNVVAQIAGRLQAVLKELAELPSARKVSKADELANRRKSRLATADPSASTGSEGRK
jgi:hypothetical protein